MADDTRTRIQAVALELFTEQGYDATSLREIAERLGVTKAALYYHFKSKEEIVESMMADHLVRLEELHKEYAGQPITHERRLEFLQRYHENLSISQHFKLMKFFQQNQPAVKNMPNATRWRETLGRMLTMLVGEDASATERMRVGLAIFGLHVSWTLLPDDSFSDAERQEAALAVARQLIDQPSEVEAQT
jgi:AcrR family transcriptional regulator